MSTEEYKALRDKILEALQISGKMLVEQKRRLNQKLVISEHGIIKTIDPHNIKLE